MSSKWLSIFQESLQNATKFIVSDYSRDERPICAQRSIQGALAEGKLVENVGLCACSSVVGNCAEDEKKLTGTVTSSLSMECFINIACTTLFIGFIKYLVDRKKCAVVNLGEGLKVYLIPVTLLDQTTVLYISAVPPPPSLQPQLADDKPIMPLKPADTSQIGPLKDSKPPSSAPLNFFASLVNRVGRVENYCGAYQYE
ncbi:hypothetical protein EON65_22180 [archaeon]|nr:MAG: hypothetical protein EON65_22180 [archaeon]